LLCRSIQELAPGTRHWIIVDSRDRAAFRGLKNARTRIVTTEELLALVSAKAGTRPEEYANVLGQRWRTLPE
jgi:hypothetical protein